MNISRTIRVDSCGSRRLKRALFIPETGQDGVASRTCWFLVVFGRVIFAQAASCFVSVFSRADGVGINKKHQHRPVSAHKRSASLQLKKLEIETILSTWALGAGRSLPGGPLPCLAWPGLKYTRPTRVGIRPRAPCSSLVTWYLACPSAQSSLPVIRTSTILHICILQGFKHRNPVTLAEGSEFQVDVNTTQLVFSVTISSLGCTAAYTISNIKIVLTPTQHLRKIVLTTLTQHLRRLSIVPCYISMSKAYIEQVTQSDKIVNDR